MNLKRVILFALLLSPLSLSAQEIALQLYSLRNEMKVDPIKYHQMIGQWGISALEGGGNYGISESEYQKLLKDNPSVPITRPEVFGPAPP